MRTSGQELPVYALYLSVESIMLIGVVELPITSLSCQHWLWPKWTFVHHLENNKWLSIMVVKESLGNYFLTPKPFLFLPGDTPIKNSKNKKNKEIYIA
jgi:hypothetical protein